MCQTKLEKCKLTQLQIILLALVATTPVSLLRNSEDKLFTTDFINPAGATVGFFIVSTVAASVAALLLLNQDNLYY